MLMTFEHDHGVAVLARETEELAGGRNELNNDNNNNANSNTHS